VSNEIARRLRVEHQSPQAILLYEGAAIWNDSHNRLTEKNFQEAVRENIKSAPQI
jgi:bacillithiol system protein YtxJ